MAQCPAPPFLRGRSAGGFMSPQTREERCRSTTLRELTRLIASSKFQNWMHEKAASSFVWKSRCWAAAFILLLCLSAFGGHQLWQHVLVLSDELVDARELLSGLQNGNVNGAASFADARKLEGQVKRQREENSKLLAKVEAASEQSAALQLNVQDLRAQRDQQAQAYDRRVHDLEIQEAMLKQQVDRLAKGLEQQEQIHQKKVQELEDRSMQMKQEAERLTELLAQQKHDRVELLDVQQEKEAQKLAKEITMKKHLQGKHKGSTTPEDDLLTEHAATQAARIRKFYLWVCITLAALAACSSGKILQQRRQLARELGAAMTKPLSSRSDDTMADDGPEPITPAAGRKSRGLRGGFQNGIGRKRCESEAGGRVTSKRRSCEIMGCEVPSVLSDLPMNCNLQEEPETPRQMSHDKTEQEKPAEKENMSLAAKEDKVVETVAMNFELRRNPSDEMVLPEDLRGTLPGFDDDTFIFSPPTAVGTIGDSETSSNLFNEALATLGQLGTGVTNYDDAHNGCLEPNSIEEDSVPPHRIRDKALHVLLDSGGVRCT
eukprot:evm.model.scf_1260EXC.5 EVM.evm.TU.scf_1260EXC.5   scf_1260EXC:23465-28597(+)